MATRYWVGGTGTWDTSNTSNWSTTSGGTGGASIPTSADDVVFDSGSDAGGIFTVTVSISVCKNLTVGALDFSMTLAGSAPIFYCFGSLFFSSTNFTFSVNGTLSMRSTSTGNTITTNGATLSNLTFDGVGGEWSLSGALVVSNAIILTNGSFVSGNYSISCNNFSSSNSNVRSLTLGTSTLTLTRSVTNGVAWDSTTSSNFSISSTGTISVVSSGLGLIFNGGGATFPTVTYSPTTTSSTAPRKLKITGSNSFSNLTLNTGSGPSGPYGFIFNNGTTQTIGTFGVVGTSFKPIFLSSDTAGSQFTLSKSSGTVSMKYTTITDSIATGGATWEALLTNGNTDGGNNVGWNFGSLPALLGNMFLMF